MFKKSWEAELIISGGFLFTLITITDALPELNRFLFVNYSGFLHELPFTTLFLGYGLKLVIFGFIIHILLRICWLTFNGLSLNSLHANRFYEKTRFTEIGQINTDAKIDHLNNLSALVFSLSAIAFFLIGSLTIWMSQLVFFGQYLIPLFNGHWAVVAIWVFYIVLSLPYLFNFLTLHRLSRTKFYKLYHPINELLSVLTLSVLYRSMTFSIFPRATWKTGALMNSLMVGGFIISTNMLSIQDLVASSEFIGKSAYAGNFRAGHTSNKYEFESPFKASIQSYIVTDNFLELAITHMAWDDKKIAQHAGKALSDFKTLPLNEKLNLASAYYQIYIDEKHFPSVFDLETKNGYQIFKTMISLDSLDTGKHHLFIVKSETEDSVVNTSKMELDQKNIYEKIPFWKVN